MPCGHICPKICHVEDRQHVKQKCYEGCLRTCSIGHPCPKKCYQDCYPCLTKVPKVLQPCNHTQTTECYQDPKEVFCVTKVVRVFKIFSFHYTESMTNISMLIELANLSTCSRNGLWYTCCWSQVSRIMWDDPRLRTCLWPDLSQEKLTCWNEMHETVSTFSVFGETSLSEKMLWGMWQMHGRYDQNFTLWTSGKLLKNSNHVTSYSIYFFLYLHF